MPSHDLGAGQGALEQLLHRLVDDAANTLSAIARTQRFGADEIIFMEGDDADDVWSIAAGVARVVRLMPDGRRQVTGFLFSGDFLGVSFNRSELYGYSAEAVTDATIRAYARRPLERLIDSDPKVRRLFLTEMSHELTAAQDRMLFLAHRSADERVAAFLLYLARRADRTMIDDKGDSDTLLIPMRWGDIADYLGLTPETVSRSMTAFRRDGLIAAVGRTGLRIQDWPNLRARAGERV